jgi:predicted restriction endonuclease
MENVSALDREVVSYFSSNWDAAALETDAAADLSVLLDGESILPEPAVVTEAIAPSKVRLTQRFFRQAVLAAYDATCCACGIHNARLLVASHIVPWSVGPTHRTNPQNGLALCALHDRAFDTGLMTVGQDHVIRFSRQLEESVAVARAAFDDLVGATIRLPTRFVPKPEFLKYHNDHVFVA